MTVTAGKFLLQKKLGEGGMGEVWLAEDAELGRRVALKFLKSTGPEEAARFRREAQLVARLNHPGIAAIYETGENYIAMQFVEGATLKDLPKHEHRAITRAIRDAALAIHYAHECGVIHRDLKPANIMFEAAKSTARSETVRGWRGIRVYVMDFGLAKQLDTKSSLSVSGMIVGTPSYMPPEQADGRAKDMGPHSDIYSLGATLYDLLGGKPPHQGLGVYDTLKKVVEEEPTPLGRLNAKVDPDLAVIVHKALAKEPAKRYRTMAAFAADLDRWMNGEPISARPPSVPEKLLKLARRNRAAVAVGVIVTIVASLALAWSVTSGVRQRDRAQQAEIERLKTLDEKRRVEMEAQREKLARLRVLELVNSAERAQIEGRNGEAEGIVDILLSEDPKQTNALNLKARIVWQRTKDAKLVLPFMERQYAVDPSPWVKLNIGTMHYALGHWEEALKWLSDWRTVESVEAYGEVGECFAQLGRFDEAYEVVEIIKRVTGNGKDTVTSNRLLDRINEIKREKNP